MTKTKRNNIKKQQKYKIGVCSKSKKRNTKINIEYKIIVFSALLGLVIAEFINNFFLMFGVTDIIGKVIAYFILIVVFLYILVTLCEKR